MLFPLGIFLYFFSPTKHYGKMIVSMITFFLFFQIIISLVFSVAGILMATPFKSSGSGLFTEAFYRLCILAGALFIILTIALLIIVQVVFTVAFPEVRLTGFALSTAGSVAGSVKNIE